MFKTLAGGCACGAIRYQCDTEPSFTWVCHCSDCQRSTGGGGAVVVVFPKPSVRFIKGEPKYFAITGSSGKQIYRGFCADCGSPVAVKTELFPDIQGIKAASLDDPSGLKLVAHIWTDSAQPWENLSPTLPKFAATPIDEEVGELVKGAQKG